MCIFYLLAGINHFRSPESYYKIIPPLMGDPALLNSLAAVIEITFAIMLLFKVTRKMACYGIILMLLAFLPSHIYMLQTGFCPELSGKLYCAPQWLLWARLIIFQPLLIYWAWRNRNV
jgi:uncharacterized membrane protein